MNLSNLSDEELYQEVRRRESFNQRQSEIFRGEREDFTDGDQHIENLGGFGRSDY